MNVKRVLGVICVLILLAAVAFASGYALMYRYFDRHRDTFKVTGATFSEHTDAIYNPYIGYYDIYGYRVSDDRYLGTEAGWHIEATVPEGRLVLLEIDLEAYADGPISEHGLGEIESLISMWEGAGKEMMVRFLYDFAGLARETEPKSIDIIKLHMSQCAEILNRHADSVYLTQSIFVGNIGEMHSSDYMTTEGMTELGRYYASVLDDGIFLSVRTPEHYRIISGRDEPIGTDLAFSDDIGARIGLFNDGMLASDNDLGTYGDGPFSPTARHEGKGSRAEEIAFQNELCRFVPSGGEVVGQNPRNDLMPAVKDLRDMHVSFIGRYHDEAVKQKWKDSVYDASEYGDEIYDGMNGYDYVERHLGYRYVVRDAYQTFRDIFSNETEVAIEIENAGFSNAYHRFDTVLTAYGADGTMIDIPIETDNRFWDSGEKSVIEFTIPLDVFEQQEYELLLDMTDPITGEPIVFANNEYDRDYGIVIGYISPDELTDDEVKAVFMEDVKKRGVIDIFRQMSK